jgi:ribosomal protein S18 acetylase RimI-like enzyme
VINGVKTIYNGGTGVIANFRGKGITASTYEYAIPLLKQKGICHHVLEVIDNNALAINIYQKIGFSTVRKLNVYKGVLSSNASTLFTLKEIESIPAEMESLFEMEPAWQNSVASTERDKASHKIVGVYIGDELAAFGSFVPASGRVKQCFVLPEHRRQGLGTGLLHHMQQNSTATQLVVTNIDESYLSANRFLEALGFQNFLGLYEMKLEVK